LVVVDILNRKTKKMKQPKRIWHIIGISFIILAFSFIFIGKAIVEKRPHYILLLLIILTYLFSFFWRYYQYYNLDKLRTGTNQRNFIDFYDNLSWFRSITIALTPFPIIRKTENSIENKIRTQIIISIIMSWVLLALLLYLMPV
jgi:phosphoglycerol transferase MdoB-like AlkP superfamily enzyme